MEKVILITGASSGIGFDAAKMLALKGNKVYAAARRVERMEPLKEYGVVSLHLDVTDAASCKACVKDIIDAEGRIDVLVNNAGFGYFGAIENVPMEEARRQMEVNVFGLAELCKAVIPHMRAAGSGRIINTSSVAGKGVLYFGGWYNVSKFSVEALSDALRMELKPFGIKVIKIQPGAIKTEWGVITAKNLEDSCAGTPYEKEASKEAGLMKLAYGKLNVLSKPAVVARAIRRAALSSCPKAVYRIGRGAWLMTGLHAILPARWWDAMMRLI